MTLKHTIVSLILIMIVGLAAWTAMFSYSPKKIMKASGPVLPDAFMEDINALFLDKQGKPKIKVITPQIIHYAKDDTTHLLSPQITLFHKSLNPWFISSKHAKAKQGIDYIHFWENVTAHHAADETHPATVIKTSTLTVYPDEQIAKTANVITLIQPNMLIRAKGMQANMKTGDIKLISQASGEYVPSE